MTWKSIRLRRLIESAVGGVWGEETGVDDVDVKCVRAADFDYLHLTVHPGNLPTRSVSRNDLRTRQLRKGDLVLEKSGGGELQPVGRVVRWDLDEMAVSSNFAARIRPAPETSDRFLAYLMASLYSAGVTTKSIKQTTGIQNLDLAKYLDERMTVPDEVEQLAIANFLDAETARIDALITTKRRMIELTSERATAALAHAFGSHVGWSPSGTPCSLGNHEMVRLGAVSTIQTGLTLDGGRALGDSVALRPYLRVANVQDGRLDLTLVKDVAIPQSFTSRFELKHGDVLMTEGGDPDKLGRGTVWKNEIPGCIHQNHVFAVRPTASLLPDFLAMVTQTHYARIYFEATASKTTGIASTSSSKIASFRIPLIPLAEQHELVERMMEQSRRVTSLVERTERQISLLQEHRQALITAAVTGEIEVPGVRR